MICGEGNQFWQTGISILTIIFYTLVISAETRIEQYAAKDHKDIH